MSYQNIFQTKKTKKKKALKLSADKLPSILPGVLDKSHIGSALDNEIGSELFSLIDTVKCKTES